MVRAKLGEIVEVDVSQIRVSFLRNAACGFFGPTHSFQSSADAVHCYQDIELVPEEHNHLVLVHVRLLDQSVT